MDANEIRQLLNDVRNAMAGQLIDEGQMPDVAYGLTLNYLVKAYGDLLASGSREAHIESLQNLLWECRNGFADLSGAL